MQPPQPLIVLLLSLAGLAGLATAWLVWSRRAASPAAAPLTALLGAMAFWDLTYAIFWSGAPNPRPHFWVDLTYLGVVLVPTTLFLFALRFTHPERPIRRRWLLALAVEPLLTLLLLFTDPAHGLFFAGKRGPTSAVILDAGPAFWVNTIYSYALVLIATLLLLMAFRRAQGLFRRQLAVILAGVAVTWINSLVLVAGLNPLPNLDNTPLSFTLVALIYAAGLLRFRLLDVTPIARHVLIERMADGVMVLDAAGRLVDLNPAARRSLGFLAQAPLGVEAGPLFASLPELAAQFASPVVGSWEAALPSGEVFEFQICPLLEPRRTRERLGPRIGALITWRDVSTRKQLESHLMHQASTDALTGVANRREVLHQGARQLQVAADTGHPLSLLLLDLDHFKDINDRCGHAVGDQALQAFVKTLRAQLRGGDILGRLGGDEFVVLLPLTNLEAATRVAERLMQALEPPIFIATTTWTAPTSLQLSASMGLVCAPPAPAANLDELMARADAALYAAKAQGRACLVLG